MPRPVLLDSIARADVRGGAPGCDRCPLDKDLRVVLRIPAFPTDNDAIPILTIRRPQKPPISRDPNKVSFDSGLLSFPKVPPLSPTRLPMPVIELTTHQP